MSDTPQLNLYQKLAKITGEVGAIKKGGQNREQNYMFIEYAAVAGELRALFAKYGVIIVPYMQRSHKQTREQFTTSRGGRGTSVLIDFTFVVRNADKPEEKFSVTWTGEATDYGDKATNKAATSALKYYLMRQFNISEQGDDPDANSPEIAAVKPPPAVTPSPPDIEDLMVTATPTQKAQITSLLRGRGVKDENFAAVVQASYGYTLHMLTKTQAADLIAKIKAQPPKAVPATTEGEQA